MSYADAQLDLSSVSVACLAGANGAGKSALLDAMTWAIWEEARAASDELIRLGEPEMWVDVRFEHEGQLYKVRRSRYKVPSKNSSKAATKGSLELQVLKESGVTEAVSAAVSTQTKNFGSKGGNGGSNLPVDERLGVWKSLTCSSVKETEELICTLLRMDYNTFVNSAYLKQGQADRFTTCLPSERKQILSEILALSYFDTLQDKCKEHTRALRQEREMLEQFLLQLPEKEIQITSLTEQGERLEAEVNAAKEEKGRQELEIAALNGKKAQLHLLKHQTDTGQAQLNSDQSDVEGLTKQSDELKARVNTLSDLVAHQGDIEQEVRQYEQIKSAIEGLEKDAFQLQELNSKRMDARSHLSDLKNRLELELSQATDTLSQAQGKIAKLKKATLDGTSVARAFAQYKELIAQETEMAKKQEAYAQLSSRVTELQNQINEWRIRLEADISQKQSLESQLALTVNEEVTLDEQKIELEKESQSLDRLEAELELTEEKGLTIKTTIESLALKIEDFQRKQREHKEKIEQLQAANDSTICPLCSSPIVDRAAVIAHYRQVIEEAEREIIELVNNQNQLEDERQALRRQYTELKDRLNKRKDLDKQIGQFNEKMEGIKRAQEARRKLASELEILQDRLKKEDFAQVEKVSLQAIEREIETLNFDPVLYSNLQAQVRLKRTIEPRYYQWQRDLADLTKLEADLPDLLSRIDDIKTYLLEENYGKEIQAELFALEKQITDLHYDRNQHNELKLKLEQLLPFTEKFRDLKRAIEEQPQIEQSLQNLQTMLRAKLDKIESAKADLAIWQEELKKLPEVEADLAKLIASAHESALGYEKLFSDYAVLQARQKQLRSEVEELATKKKSLAEVKAAFDDYSFLAEAFGKKGIQAVIIENAIPEIEADANRLLARLSDNQMHVALITQQKNKAGNVVETLDILIGDSVGTRSYELYSGGEAFKVNFAVRVALSRLLARRSGAKLETLIIDEGFGSQDELSRDRLVKAIRSIQNDFARILVITHFADVKEMFPTHIFVSKINGRSQIQLLA
jgi:exonuclease SbcC